MGLSAVAQRRCQRGTPAVAGPAGALLARPARLPRSTRISALPPTVNWHLEAACNYGCTYCFARFEDIPNKERLGAGAREALLSVPRALRDAGADKITFVGGEPFLHPLIDELIAAAKAAGLTTSAVTNASLLTPARLKALAPVLDWLAVSVDASNDSIHHAMGRKLRGAAGGDVNNGHLTRVLPVWREAKRLGYRLKLNTVVTRLNVEDDMSALVAEMAPDRWKALQVLPVGGQNDGFVEELLISAEDFGWWVERQRLGLSRLGSSVPLVAESNDLMRGSYAMMDARCRFFQNDRGPHRYGRSIFEAGSVLAAWDDVATGFSALRFEERGGRYEWRRKGVPVEAQ